MNVLLCVCVCVCVCCVCVCVKIEDKSLVAMETESFIFAYRNKFVLINIACLIALTINFEDLTP